MVAQMIEGRPEAAVYAGVLAACERVAPKPGEGQKAALTWFAAQTMGWQAARELHTTSLWYKRLRILKAAGLPVPRRIAGIGYADEQRPKLPELIGRRFTVRQSWQAPTLVQGHPVDLLPVGSVGAVERLVISSEGLALGLDVAGGYEEVSPAVFLASVELLPDHVTCQ